VRKDLVLMSADSMKNAPRIVVGVDGSPSSRVALRWAVRQAALTGGVVDAVIAWQIPMALSGYAWAPISADETNNLAEDARKALDAVISEEVEPADSDRVTAHVVNGHPADVLLAAAADADLLVVGSRGHGSFAEALLGSVGQYCVHHAHCPVLIMRGEPHHAAA
jgi:nucleotide-binding universal stress UspA family protein